jgi:hypothetical protein
MTRKSRREIEQMLEDLESDDADPGTVREWVQNVMTADAAEGDITPAEYTVVDADGNVVREPDHAGQVCIAEPRAEFVVGYWIDEARVPEWIDPEEDLPVVV